MRLLHTADLHLGLQRHGHLTPSGLNSRIEDFTDTLRRIGDEAISRGVALVVLAGDTFNSRREGPQERNALATLVRRLTDAGIGTIILPGNHDGMSTIGDASTHSLLWLQSLGIEGCHVLTAPGKHRIETRDGPVDVIAVPYPHKRLFETMLPDMEPDARLLEAGKRMDRIVRELKGMPTLDVPMILVGHFTTMAAKVGSETTMRPEWDVSVHPTAFNGYDYVALGHIHRQQQVAPNAWYAGSPEYIDFGEEGQNKGFLIVHVEAGRQPLVEPIPSGARAMVTLHVAEDGYDTMDSIDGAIVRLWFDFTSRPPAQYIARVRAAALRAGAYDVVPHWEAPKQQARTRVTLDPEADRVDIVRAWLESKGHPVEPTLAAARELIAGQITGAS
jgi:DNA repair protein SbcD/Mre11